MANRESNLIANNAYSSSPGHWVGVPAKGTAGLIRLKLHSPTSVILLHKITKVEDLYIGQPQSMGLSFASLPVLTDNCGSGYTVTVKREESRAPLCDLASISQSRLGFLKLERESKVTNNLESATLALFL